MNGHKGKREQTKTIIHFQFRKINFWQVSSNSAGGPVIGVRTMKEPESFGEPEFEYFSKQTRGALLQQALERAEQREEIRRAVFLNATVFLPLSLIHI